MKKLLSLVLVLIMLFPVHVSAKENLTVKLLHNSMTNYGVDVVYTIKNPMKKDMKCTTCVTIYNGKTKGYSFYRDVFVAAKHTGTFVCKVDEDSILDLGIENLDEMENFRSKVKIVESQVSSYIDLSKDVDVQIEKDNNELYIKVSNKTGANLSCGSIFITEWKSGQYIYGDEFILENSLKSGGTDYFVTYLPYEVSKYKYTVQECLLDE